MYKVSVFRKVKMGGDEIKKEMKEGKLLLPGRGRHCFNTKYFSGSQGPSGRGGRGGGGRGFHRGGGGGGGGGRGGGGGGHDGGGRGGFVGRGGKYWGAFKISFQGV